MSGTPQLPPPPTFADVLGARARIRPHLPPTPLRWNHMLSRELGCEVYVKHENLTSIGAFKIRGGINLIARLSAEERRAGLITASTGNHGQSIAYGARLFGVSATVCAPVDANPLKLTAMRDLGARVILHGTDFDQARLHAEDLAEQSGARYVHPANEPDLIAGVATWPLEALEECPELDVFLVPVGGGSGAAGASLVASTVNPAIEVIGAQSAQAPAAYRAWLSGEPTSASNTTVVEGVATGTSFDLTIGMLRNRLADFIVLDDEEIVAAVAPMIESTRTLVETAGAIPLAAARRLRDRLTGRRICLACTGANITPAQLKAALP